MKKMARKALSGLLSLALMLSLLPGGSLTAYAESEVTDALPTSAGEYKLTKDLTISGTWEPKGTTTLDLNGYGIRMTGNGSVIKVNSGVNLTIKDTASSRAHYITLTNYRGTAVADSGTESAIDTSGSGVVKVIGGYITGGTGYAISTSSYSSGGGVYIAGGFNVTGGKFNMSGVTIIGNQADRSGGGVYVPVNGEFTMSSGAIIYNSAGANGGGVYTDNTFTMTSGSVTGNKAGNDGGGVYVNDGTFAMSGGNITGNTAGNCAGGVYVNGQNHSSTFFKLSGSPEIKNNSNTWGAHNVYLPDKTGEATGGMVITIDGDLSEGASIGVSMVGGTTGAGTFTSGLSGKLPSGKTVDQIFTSDAGYAVSLDSNNEAQIVSHTHSFSYSLSTDKTTITATCTNADGNCTLPTDSNNNHHTATLTIAAPTTGGDAAVVTVSPEDAFGTLPDVKYQTKSGNDWGAETITAPTTEGFHKASITLGEEANTATASVIYGINCISYQTAANGTVSGTTGGTVGATITPTISPGAGYELNKLTVTKTGTTEAVSVTDNKSFVMPEANVTVSATFRERSVPVNLTVTDPPEGCSASLLLLDESYKEKTAGDTLTRKLGEKFVLSVICDGAHGFNVSDTVSSDNITSFTDDEIESYEAANGSLSAQANLFWITMPAVSGDDLTITVNFLKTETYTILYQPASAATEVWCCLGVTQNNFDGTYTSKLRADAAVGDNKVWALSVSGAFIPKQIAFAATEDGARAAAATNVTVQSTASLSWTDVSGDRFVVIGGNAKTVVAAFVSGAGSLAVVRDDKDGKIVANGTGRGDGVSYQIAVCLLDADDNVTTPGTVTAPAAPTAPEGYTFGGWRGFRETTPVTEETYSANTSISVSGNTVFNAIWNLKTSKITLNLNGGTGGSAVSTVNYGEKLTLSEDPTRAGYVFGGWAVSEAVTEDGKFFSKGSLFDFDTSITTDLALTAQWKHVHSYYAIQISDFGESLSKYAEYGSKLHVRISDCYDISLEAHSFNSEGECECGYKKPAPTNATLQIAYVNGANDAVLMREHDRTAAVNQEVSVYAPSSINNLEFSKWQYSTDSGASWRDLAATTMVGFIIPRDMQVRAVYVNPVTVPQVSLNARSYDYYDAESGYTVGDILFHMDYKLPDGYTYLDSGIRMGDNQGISFYTLTEQKKSAAASAFEFGAGFALSFFESPLAYLMDYAVQAAIKKEDPQYIVEKREDNVLNTMSAETLSDYMYQKKPINIEEYDPIYWEGKPTTTALSGSANTLVPARFAQKNNGDHYIYGIAYLRYKKPDGTIQTIYTKALATTLNQVETQAAETVTKTGN